MDFQFTGDSRNQSRANTCNTFASIGALEAAFFRHYNEKINLAEKWVIREIVGQSLKFIPYSGKSATYLGASPERLLEIVKEKGICLEEHYPYDGFELGKFDSEDPTRGPSKLWGWFSSLFKSTPIDPESQKIDQYNNTIKKFAGVFLTAQDPKLSACKEYAAEFKAKASVFHSLQLSDVLEAQIIELINFGIPVHTSVGTFNGMKGSHAVLITGYDMNLGKFKLRNSWGADSVDYLLFSAITANDTKGGRVLGLKVIYSDSDIVRACETPEEAPSVFREVMESKCLEVSPN